MKKNLILFYPSFERGGVEKILENLIQNNTKFKISLISSKSAKKNINLKKINFIEVTEIVKIPFIHKRYLSAINAMIVLYKYLSKNKKKYLIHSMQSNVAAIIVSIFKRNKIIIRNSENPIYSFFYSESKFSSFISLLLKYIFYNFADGIITNSNGSKKSLKRFLFNKKKIKAIYNPYLEKISNKKNKKNKYLISIGRLRKQKDHETLLKAFYIFSKMNSDYKLLILGHGNLEIKLKKLARDLKIHKRVIFKGWVKNTTSYLKFSKFFVLSSVYEGLGNVLIDAINYDIPCISTNCYSGPREILLNGKGGYLVKVKSPELLAQKISFCVNNYSDALKKNTIAKKALKRFLIIGQSKKYFDYLTKHN
jgi:glycosyltransferase involved in cell wall biosynthesis|tara:strand:- start:762 stop:1859 length:1098 start_codon:yes stop_codon:yes gene_type:complete